MEIRLWLGVLGGTFSFVSRLVKVIFPTTHFFNFPEPKIPTVTEAN